MDDGPAKSPFYFDLKTGLALMLTASVFLYVAVWLKERLSLTWEATIYGAVFFLAVGVVTGIASVAKRREEQRLKGKSKQD
ncbi:MAG: hypothetical protein KIS92_15495 [Planctomycetota bacterium]|nr:hypothetical protein [Planctomycetota bacterium]